MTLAEAGALLLLPMRTPLRVRYSNFEGHHGRKVSHCVLALLSSP